jgi:hypothetical protein
VEYAVLDIQHGEGYVKKFNCQSQSGGVTVTYIYSDAGGTGLGSSITYTAFNSEDGKRHWTGAVLWNTSSADSNQYNHSCRGYQVYANRGVPGPPHVREEGQGRCPHWFLRVGLCP